MQLLILFTTSLIIAACSSSPKVSSTDPSVDYAQIFNSKLRVATKEDLVSELGGLEWCKTEEGPGETCQFYFVRGKRWSGTRLKKTVETYDKITAKFDEKGVLRSFTSKFLH